MSYSKAEIEHAVESGGIVPYFQPIVEMHSGRIIGFEALARWLHPLSGLILPKDFIHLTESYGLSRNLTCAMMRQLIETAHKLPSHLEYSVNVSPLQLRDSSLSRTIEDSAHACAPSGKFPLDRLIIEITESAFVHNLGQAASIATEIKALGPRLAIDDFGTGYSGLLHLQAMPFDVIKVDRNFVRHMVRQHCSHKIVAAVLGLGRSLGLTTIAEGVEDEEQERILKSLGCNLGQGWRYGYPMPAETLPEFLAEAEKSLEKKSCQLADPPLEALNLRSGHTSTVQLEHLQSVLSDAPVGICILDRNAQITCVNQYLEKLLPRQNTTDSRQTLEDLLPQAAFMLRPHVLRALKGEPVHSVEIPLQLPDFRQHATFGLASLRAVRDDANKVIAVAMYITDVTRRKQVHEALRQSNAHLSTLWSSVPFGIVTGMGAGSACTLSGNPEAEHILRHPIVLASQYRERKIWRIFDEQARLIAWEDIPLMRAMREARPIAPERMLYLRGDESLTRLQVTAAPLLTTSGEVFGGVMTLIDLENKLEKTYDANLAAGLAATLWGSESSLRAFDSLVSSDRVQHSVKSHLK